MKNTAKPDFASLSLSTVLYDAIKKAGYEKPTDVQSEAIPAILEGKDILARAETGSGKTAAFVLPILERIIRRRAKKKNQNSNKPISNRKNIVEVVVLVPTRELAIQIREEFEAFSADFEEKVKCLSVYGGVKINPQMIGLRGGADVIVSTPGRLLDLERNNAIKLHQVQTLVVDEVDRLMKGDFEEEIDSLFKLMPRKRQNLMFTATFPSSIRKLVRRVMNEPEIINVDDLYDDVDILQRVITLNHDKKNDVLAHLLKENDWKQVLVFCSAKRTCDNLVRKMEKRDVQAVAMHGNLQQNARARALKDFKDGKTRVLIATDVAGRGIDIGQLPCVINYELPRSPNDYTHRIGRTGRAGEQGVAISLIAHHEFQHFAVIEKRNGIRLEREQIKGFEVDKEAPAMPNRTKSKPKKKKSKKSKGGNSNKTKEGFYGGKVTSETGEKTVEKTIEKTEAAKDNTKANSKKTYSKKPKTSEVVDVVKMTDKAKTAKEPKKELKTKPKKEQQEEAVNVKPPAGASLYTRKLPKVSDDE